MWLRCAGQLISVAFKIPCSSSQEILTEKRKSTALLFHLEHLLSNATVHSFLCRARIQHRWSTCTVQLSFDVCNVFPAHSFQKPISYACTPRIAAKR
jgi:hypothetical protein